MLVTILKYIGGWVIKHPILISASVLISLIIAIPGTMGSLAGRASEGTILVAQKGWAFLLGIIVVIGFIGALKTYGILK